MTYGNKRDFRKIDIFLDGQYKFSTTWAKSLRLAKEKASEAIGAPISRISARYA